MSQQGLQLLRTADAQISALIETFSARDEGVLRRRCPGRAKFADGTIGAVAWHTAENYGRIANFLNDQPDGGHADPQSGQAVTRSALLDLLSNSRDSLRVLGSLSEERLRAVPPAGSMRFCDGERTLQEVITALLSHQAHNVEALTGAAS
jgi:hypothetical protein